MSKKHYILSFLLFTYAIVLGHSVVPHGHFDDLFTTEHNHDSHNDHESDHKHNYPFSHSVTLHVAIEKQTVFNAHSAKNTIKKASISNIGFIPIPFKPPILPYFSVIEFNYCTQPLIQVCSNSFLGRAPPVLRS